MIASLLAAPEIMMSGTPLGIGVIRLGKGRLCTEDAGDLIDIGVLGELGSPANPPGRLFLTEEALITSPSAGQF